MPKTKRASIVPKTPGGIHLEFADVSADEIDFDDEVTIKASVFRGRNKTPAKLRLASSVREVKSTPKDKKRFVLRNSTDLKKIRRIDDRIEAILNSPMIEVRRKPLTQSQSFTSGEYEDVRTPIRVPSSKDLEAVTSRRLSAALMSKFAPLAQSLPSLGSSRASVCPSDLSQRRRLTGKPITPISKSLNLGHVSPIGSPISPSTVEAGASLDDEPAPVSVNEFVDIENQAPDLQAILSGEDDSVVGTTQSVVNSEPASFAEFRVLANVEYSRLSSAKSAWEDVMGEESESIPETALNSIRVVVGKCGLLLGKKFPFFLNLVDQAELGPGDSDKETGVPRPTTGVNDLLGLWEIIANEIADIDGAFGRLRRWRKVSGWALELRPKTPARYADKKSEHPYPKSSRHPSGRKSNVTTPTIASTLKSVVAKPIAAEARKRMKSKLRAPKNVGPSRFAQFRAQVLSKNRAAEKSNDASTTKLPNTNVSPVKSPKESNNKSSSSESLKVNNTSKSPATSKASSHHTPTLKQVGDSEADKGLLEEKTPRRARQPKTTPRSSRKRPSSLMATSEVEWVREPTTPVETLKVTPARRGQPSKGGAGATTPFGQRPRLSAIGKLTTVTSTPIGDFAATMEQAKGTPSLRRGRSSSKQIRMPQIVEHGIGGESINTTANVGVAAAATLDSFAVPDSRPRKRARKDTSSVLYASSSSTASMSMSYPGHVTPTSMFSQPPRPLTGTPRPPPVPRRTTQAANSLRSRVTSPSALDKPWF